MIGWLNSAHVIDWLRVRKRFAHAQCVSQLGQRTRPVKMAAYTLIRSGGGILNGLKCSLKTFTHVPQSGAALLGCKVVERSQWRSSAQLSVQDRIESKRRAALQGGGQARIQAQHKRVENTKKTHKTHTQDCTKYKVERKKSKKK